MRWGTARDWVSALLITCYTNNVSTSEFRCREQKLFWAQGIWTCGEIPYIALGSSLILSPRFSWILIIWLYSIGYRALIALRRYDLRLRRSIIPKSQGIGLSTLFLKISSSLLNPPLTRSFLPRESKCFCYGQRKSTICKLLRILMEPVMGFWWGVIVLFNGRKTWYVIGNLSKYQ
jgi:hypothetical protein